MNNDIVKEAKKWLRLEEAANWDSDAIPVVEKLLDTIEKLQKENDRKDDLLKQFVYCEDNPKDCETMDKKITKLEAALRQIEIQDYREMSDKGLWAYVIAEEALSELGGEQDE